MESGAFAAWREFLRLPGPSIMGLAGWRANPLPADWSASLHPAYGCRTPL